MMTTLVVAREQEKSVLGTGDDRVEVDVVGVGRKEDIGEGKDRGVAAVAAAADSVVDAVAVAVDADWQILVAFQIRSTGDPQVVLRNHSWAGAVAARVRPMTIHAPSCCC